MRKHLYTDEQLVDCYLKYKSQIKAAEELGVSRETVARAVHRRGIKLTGRDHNGRNQPGRKITDEQLIKDAETLNCREIAVKYNMSEERVWRRARRLGISLKSRCCGGRWGTRAARYGCKEFDRSITLKELIKRDGGICQLCGKPTDGSDINDGHIGKRYPTLDHIVPLSKGGTHTWDNVQLAHMSCNARKCDRITEGNDGFNRSGKERRQADDIDRAP